jgi:predicted amidohydrolase
LLPRDSDGRRFAIELDDAKQIALAQNASNLIEQLEQSAVDVAVLPECVAGEKLVRALRKALMANYRVSALGGRLPNLRLLVIGTVADRQNEAAVIGANGKTIFRQPKTQRWRLTVEQQTRYGLAAELGSVDRSEDIDEGSTLTYLDDSGFGRVGVLICEDLDRGDPSWLVTHAVTPTIILSPVLDASLAERRWAYKAAERVATEPGALVLVATSFVLALREAESGGKPADEVGIGIVAHPDDHDQTVVVLARPAASCCETRLVTWPQAWE